MTNPSTGEAVTRRTELRFETVDDAVAEARQLLSNGYATAGKWSLGQACDHLAKFTNYSLDGFPSRGLPWPLNAIARGILLSDAKLSRPMPGGLPTAPFLKPHDAAESDGDERERDAAAVEAFAVECGRLKERVDAGGPFAKSPLFGHLTPDRWRRVHLNHAALHLGHLVPVGAA